MIAQLTLTVNIFIYFRIDKCTLVCYNVKARFGAYPKMPQVDSFLNLYDNEFNIFRGVACRSACFG